MSPDTQQNILVAGMLLIRHNFFALFYFFAMIISIGWALWKPTRGAILMIVGFALLLFAFEYHKHILDGLLEQTKGSLVTERQSFTIEWILDKTLGKFLTPFLYFIGALCTAAGIFLQIRSRGKSSSSSTRH